MRVDHQAKNGLVTQLDLMERSVFLLGIDYRASGEGSAIRFGNCGSKYAVESNQSLKSRPPFLQ